MFATLTELTRRFRAGRPTSAVILLYHRVATPESDPWSLCVEPGRFEEQMRAIRRLGRPMFLSDLVRSLQKGTVPRRAVVVTFDDGYVDNFAAAAPRLARHEVPATMFITTGGWGMTREFWWDELEQLVLQPGRLPETVSLRLQGQSHEWRLDGSATLEEAVFRRHLRWSAGQPEDPTPRHTLYRQLYALLQPASATERQRAMDELWQQADRKPTLRPAFRIMDESQLKSLAQSPWIEIGAHTVTHPNLASLNAADQSTEISGSRRSLERLLQRQMRGFAYPFGKSVHYNDDTLRIVKENGFDSACSTTLAAVRSDSPRFELPRFPVQDWSGDELETLLESWWQEPRAVMA